MEPFSDDQLSEVFKRNSRNRSLMGSRESSTLEFKETFHFGSLPEYGRIMASFANTGGGYIVFGVKDKPREPVGIRGDKFDDLDIARATEGLNAVFSPEIRWAVGVHDWDGRSFGLLYTYEHTQKPVVATASKDSVCSDGDVFYRYNARTQKIRFGELRRIIEERVEQERKSWKQVFESAASIGPQNALIMDAGELDARDIENPLLIDSSMLDSLDLREASEDSEGSRPVYEISGTLHGAAVLGVRKQRVVVNRDIHQYRATDVARRVEDAIGKPFRTQAEHIKAWRYHKVRPSVKRPDALPFKNKYCEYKEYDEHYRFSQQWIDALVEEYTVDENYQRLVNLPMEVGDQAAPWV